MMIHSQYGIKYLCVRTTLLSKVLEEDVTNCERYSVTSKDTLTCIHCLHNEVSQ